MKTTHTYTPGKVKQFALQSLIKSKSKITKLSKTSIEKGMLFYQEIYRLPIAEIQHKLDKITNNSFIDRPLSMQQGNTHV